MNHGIYKKITTLLALCFFIFARDGFALGQIQYVENVPGQNSFPIVQQSVAATLCVDTNDFDGVVRAATDLQSDIRRVTSLTPKMVHGENPGTNAIIIGTIGKSKIIDELIREKKIDVSQIAGKWESFFLQVVRKPFPGIENALIICGSDKRGTIYGIYDLSEEIGVSPWYWWADVPVQHKDSLFVKAGKFVQGPPAVKYRGIFLNDEWPCLGGWATEKFGGLNHSFYTNVFELLLRLKANYLWPAMWNNCFNEDDPLNPKLADEYGIVMGTSHVEPMMRADKEWSRLGYTARQWNYAAQPELLDKFWREGIERNNHYESIVTVGMRGKTDSPMAGVGNLAGNISLLEKIVADQRNILSEILHTNADDVPQDWAIYKEVQNYYDHGARVPDDVTLLWSDDNWGNLRRLPTPDERRRSGGAGIYYHFDYVGDPRNYKWINTVQIEKTWEQMNLAYHYGANRIWIVNVGDLKPLEFPMEFFLTFAWNPTNWPPKKISEFTRLWARREFGPKFAPQIADIVSEYTKYNARRKPELLAPNTFSLVNYQEADNVLADWKAIADEAEGIDRKLPANERDAFFELVLYPTKASEIVNALYVAAAKNRLYAAQGRASANDFAAQVKKLFQADADLSGYYNHVLAGGKWDHMMDQTHIGYTRWQEPPSNNMPAIVEIKIPDKAKMGVAIEGSTNVWPGNSSEGVLPDFDKFNRSAHYIDVFNKGKMPFEFSAMASALWIQLSSKRGTIEKEKRLWVSIDWKNAPRNSTNGFVKISSGTNSVFVQMHLFNPNEPSRKSVNGFVETDGYVSIEAEHFTKKVDSDSAHWEKIPNLGRTLSAMTIFPATAASVTPPENSPRLEYKMYLFQPKKVDVEAILSPTLNFVPGRGLRFAISFDDQPPRIFDALAHNSHRDWQTAVED
ncbi:MAG: glycosyl hydrolase 115 family protein, partial [Limisphaerales bacterium]